MVARETVDIQSTVLDIKYHVAFWWIKLSRENTKFQIFYVTVVNPCESFKIWEKVLKLDFQAYQYIQDANLTLTHKYQTKEFWFEKHTCLGFDAISLNVQNVY